MFSKYFQELFSSLGRLLWREESSPLKWTTICHSRLFGSLLPVEPSVVIVDV
ncbi:hypothetical protein D918_01047 [Trichuris suis]|nr:hypothetical protein D918_01047 [Trichuris suis]